MVAHGLLKSLDATRAAEHLKLKLDIEARAGNNQDGSGRVFSDILEIFYAKQLEGDQSGEISVEDLVAQIKIWGYSESAISAVFTENNLRCIFGPAPFLHWQQLLLRIERDSVIFQDFITETESRLSSGVIALLRDCFTQLDPSRFGVVPLLSMINRLECTELQRNLPLAYVCEALRIRDKRSIYPSVTWSELVQIGLASLDLSTDHITDSVNDLRPRLKMFFGRFFLRKGQLDDALRYLQVATAEEEQRAGFDSVTLVPYYLNIAEALALRFKQLSIVSQQTAFEIAEKWLNSIEGSRSLRLKALEVIDRVSTSEGKILPKKVAEAEAREGLLKEYAALSLVRPDSTMVDDAVEYCTKAWTLQEKAFGREHITTGAVHASLAQIYAVKQEWTESVRCYVKAIEIFESSCSGPVPASALLHLEVAKIQHHHLADHKQAASIYDEVGEFFHSFAKEFTSSDSTRRDACALAIDAWRQWISLVASAPGKLCQFRCTMEEQRAIETKIHIATEDGYGEFSHEAAESGAELAQYLVKIGQLRQAERHLRTVCYILESHFGPNDRRCRKARRELTEISSELKGGAGLDDTHGDHEWLTL